MSHTHRSKDKLVARIRRLKGQMEAVERALESEQPCGDVLQLLASIRGALSGLTVELMQEHLSEHVVQAETDAERRQAASELAEALRTYMRGE
ncbi:Ni(II)/Co(II)-sensing transcriptional repressor DmeR [Rhizobium lemnae]|uniref:DNA-binding FrmR family transcriptional regulator n=2 Tax=Rhizobium TaxID=379 RepID=A0A7W6LEC3_9HYPH|nr:MULTISPECIES: Ni(II)/Co(II)-sensing transcriptional repressor DmeR [Rhizobium]MBB4142805.1 DNA-binding FrmR family transcriptional regulator [Rhizobium rhizoryzae]MCJ8507510.1 Ni(II)/Co(II)-sensing transcriptional repressor DmeR [Rhizobium lemnae]